MNVVSLRDAMEQLTELVHRAQDDVDTTVIAAEDGERAVLISLDEFNAWQETLHLLSTPANAEHLARAITEAEAGKFVKQDLID